MNTKKLIACLLALVMVLCTLPLVFAYEVDAPEDDNTDIGVNIPAGEEEEILYGDVDGRNGVTYDDAMLVLWHLAGKNVTLDLTAADVTGTDGEVTYDDAMLILWYLAGKVTALGPTS